MSRTITIRLTESLAEWLAHTARTTGVPQGRIVRLQLENAQRGDKQPFMRLAGTVSGPPDLSSRNGFSKA